MILLCATPIGNLEDITLRVINALRDCDGIYAEDTRRTLALLNHLGIKKPLFSCHEHNERQRAEEIVARSKAGETLVVVSDAGMPGISDPGAAVAAAAIAANEPFTVCPGASAVLMSAVLSGLDCARFCFEGFLPREKKPRRERLELLQSETRTTVLYESPFRLKDTLLELLATLGDRPCAVCRELTKLHEEVCRGTLSSVAGHFDSPPKGECVIIVDGAAEKGEALPTEEDLLWAMAKAVAAGEKPKAAAKRLAQGITPSELYNRYMRQKEDNQ